MMNIHEAAFAGRNDLIHSILTQDPSQVNQVLELRSGDTVRKVTPLYLAVIEGQLNTVQLLLDANATLDPEGCEKLFDWALLSKERRKVCKTVAKHFANAQNFIQESSLSHFNDHSTTLKTLLSENGFAFDHDVANLNYYYWLGETQSLEAVQACLKEGDDQFEVAGIFIGALLTGNQPILDYLKEQYQFSTASTVASGMLKGMNLPALAVYSDNIEALSILKEHGCDLNATPLEGPFQGMTLASIAAGYGTTKALGYLREIGLNINAFCGEGPFNGLTPIAIATRTGQVKVLELFKANGFALTDFLGAGGMGEPHPIIRAISHGKVELLKFFKEMGYDFTQSFTYRNMIGFTCPMVASFQNQVPVLEYLQSIGVKVNDPIAKGERVNTTPFGTAILVNSRPVMKFFYKSGFEIEHELSRHLSPGKQFMSMLQGTEYIGALNTLQDFGLDLTVLPYKVPGVKKLTSSDQVTIVYYQLQVHQSWFEWNRARFLREMKSIDALDWVMHRTWKEIHPLLLKYRALGGNVQEWVQRALPSLINVAAPFSEEEALEVFAFVDPSPFHIEDFIDAVRPGYLLLELLKMLSQTKGSYASNQTNHLEIWISRLLNESSGDEQFWTQSRDSLKAIRQKIVKPVHRGKGRGAQGKKDAFEALWRKFDKRIQEANSTEEMLQAVIAAKQQEINEQVKDLLQENETFAKKFERKWTIGSPPDVEDSIEREYTSAKVQKIQAFLTDLSPGSLLQEEVRFLQHDFKDFKKIATLEAETSKVAAGILSAAKQRVTAYQKRVSERAAVLEAELVTLEKAKTFKQLQRKMQHEPRPASLLKPYAHIEKRYKAREEAVWREHEQAVAQAQSVAELNGIRLETESRINDLAQSLMAEMVVRSQEMVPVKQTRMQRIEEYKDQKIAEQKNEIDRLLQEIERLKQTVQRPASPEKITPVVEAPLVEQLIQKLRVSAPNSPSAKEALKMLEREGKILTRVSEIVLFLALFGFTHDRTSGSHSTYTDGTNSITIADHDGESKPYQIEDALELILNKLNSK